MDRHGLRADPMGRVQLRMRWCTRLRSNMGARILCAPLALFALTGCSATLSNLVQVPAGRGSRPDIEGKVSDILNRQGYVVQDRRDTGILIQYGTSWTTRECFEDELDRGAVECRTRLTFEARRGGNEVYALSLRAETTSLDGEGGGEWAPLVATAMFREHLQEVAESISLELDAGVRTR